MSITPTYEQLFHWELFLSAFLYFQLMFEFFRQKEIGAKAALETLVILNPVSQFYQHFKSSFCGNLILSKNTIHVSREKESISSTFYVRVFRMKVFWAAFLCLEFGFEQTFVQKCTHKMLMKLTQGRQKQFCWKKAWQSY